MKKLILHSYFCLLLFSLSCTIGNRPKYCSPIKAVELLINNPRYTPSKTETGYYQISNEDENFMYFGYQTIDLKLKKEMNPFYKTDKREFHAIFQRTSNLDLLKAESIINSWFIEKFPELKADSTQVAQTMKIKFVYDKIADKYDANCSGWIEFYFSRMEKSATPDVDSVMTNHTIKKFGYNTLIKNGKSIEWMKSYVYKEDKAK
ncbi:hypothetical protein [Chryseobacterium sp. SIMBA_029]|uniref:hypothetical protein n=1 Tax=Chryseobacterium sp. SIMBA_029 TaxID=3085772 RepID=UPI00397836F9